MFAIFAGQNAKGYFKKTIYKILSQKIPITQISQKSIYTKGRLTTVFELNPKIISCQNCDIVVLNSCTANAQISGEKYLICNSSNINDINLSKKSNSEIITCGMALRDTATFSSFTDDTCVFSLQRQITRIDGSKAEPFELPIICDKDDDRYAILVSHIILLILGYI